MCSRDRLTQHMPFEKCASYLSCYQKWTNDSTGKNETYEILFTAVRSGESRSRSTVELQHYINGPTLIVECCEFLPTYPNQTRIFHQDSHGWQSAETTVYCLANKVDMSLYVQDCIGFALSEACAFRRPTALFFRLAWLHKDVSKVFSTCKRRANM